MGTMSVVEDVMRCMRQCLTAREFRDLMQTIDDVRVARLLDPRPDAEEIPVPIGSLIVATVKVLINGRSASIVDET
ncbi:hypothetical protein [Microlunatus sp. GCM10028923]|uniref:hypothetical protein n=1 Tax=Microlunatus sp. GCM10028923 TaxID=3273400 RepID=UPI00360D38D5